MSHSNETYEMQSSTGPPHTSTDEDQDEQVWRDVKAETGFSSYKEYVETLVDSEQRFGELLEYLSSDAPWDRWGEIFVLDIQKDESKLTSSNSAQSRAEPRRPFYGSYQYETDRKVSTRLLQTLRSPPEDIPVRIVLWSIHPESRPHASIIEALGLGLDLDPLFFESLSQLREVSGKLLSTRSHQIIIGDSIATVARDYRRERDSPPILIIAGYFDLHFGFTFYDEKSDKAYDRILKKVMSQEISRATSLFRPRPPPNDLASVPSNDYLKLLSSYVYKDCYINSEVDAILMNAVLPLLCLETVRLRGQLSRIHSVLRYVQFDVEHPEWYDAKKEERYSLLDRQRFWLRRTIEGLQESRDTFQKFARSQNAADWLETETWQSQDADTRETLGMARSKELEVRDFMQLQIGNLSISESRKSIQLSNQQMSEAKRGKKFM